MTPTSSSDWQTAEPTFLDVDDVVEIHDYRIGLAPELRGFLNESALHSAVAAPRNTFYYEGGDFFDIAAVYLVHVAKAHAFVDGNKRTAYVSAMAFLAANGCPIVHGLDTLDDLTVAAVTGEIGKPDVAAALRNVASCAD